MAMKTNIDARDVFLLSSGKAVGPEGNRNFPDVLLIVGMTWFSLVGPELNPSCRLVRTQQFQFDE